MFCMLLGMFSESQLYRLTRLFYWIYYVQIPVAIYQVIFVVPKRVAFRGEDEKWDSVVGTLAVIRWAVATPQRWACSAC